MNNPFEIFEKRMTVYRLKGNGFVRFARDQVQSMEAYNEDTKIILFNGKIYILPGQEANQWSLK